MTVNKNNKIVAFVGLSGAGKSVAADYVIEKGYPKVYFGGVVLDAMTAAGIEHTEENERPFREESCAAKTSFCSSMSLIVTRNQVQKYSAMLIEVWSRKEISFLLSPKRPIRGTKKH